MAYGERPKLLPKTKEAEIPYRPLRQSMLIMSNTMRVVELRHCVLIRPDTIANYKRTSAGGVTISESYASIRCATLSCPDEDS